LSSEGTKKASEYLKSAISFLTLERRVYRIEAMEILVVNSTRPTNSRMEKMKR
jgi:hypothetical protein